MGHNRDEVLQASTTQTADGYSGILDFMDGSTYSKAAFVLDVTAASGSLPTLNVFVQCELPENNSWTDMVAFTQMTGLGKRIALVVTPAPDAANAIDFSFLDRGLAAGTVRHLLLGPRYRVGWKIAGVTPSFTFSVKATIHT